MSNVKNKTTKYQIIFAVVSIVMAIRCVGKTLATSLTTVLSFSYDYGFVDKSLMGTLFRLICPVFTDNIYSYKTAFIFSAIVMFAGVFCYIIMGIIILRRIKEDRQELIFILLFLFTIFAMSLYTAEDYIGSAESVMLTIMLLNVICIVGDTNIIPMLILPLAGMVFSSDYLFAYMGVTIMLLMYRYHNSKGSNKYLIVLIINIIIISQISKINKSP